MMNNLFFIGSSLAIAGAYTWIALLIAMLFTPKVLLALYIQGGVMFAGCLLMALAFALKQV